MKCVVLPYIDTGYVVLPYLCHLFFYLLQMVSSYKRKTDRQSWSSEDMQKAIEAVNNRRMGWKKASIMFNVPQATLRRRAQEKNTHARGVEKCLGRFKKSLSVDLEQRMIAHILDLESRLFGLTTYDLRVLAYKLAERSGCEHQFNKEKKVASRQWVHSFLSRHPNISLRVPEATSAARAQAFNKPQVQKFFKKLEETIQNNNIQSTMIFNMDETKLTTVQRTQKIIAKRGKKQVGAITSAERGVHTTGVVCMSSSGNFIPPALIFPRKKFNPDLYDAAPPGTLPLYNESAYMTGDLFFKWIKHFVKFVRPTNDNKALLILDGHASHKNLESLEFAKKAHVVLLCLPAHCTHRLQPLDVSFFAPLENYYSQEVRVWLKEHPGRTVSIYQIASLFAKAYNKAATVGIALSGFRATGIYPLNPNIFPDYLYLPSAATDIPEDGQINEQQSNNETKAQTDPLNCDSTASISGNLSAQSHSKNEETDVSVILKELSPVPVASASTSRRQKKNSYQSVLTESPFLNELKEKEAEKKEKERRKSERARIKKRIHVDSSDDEVTFNNDDTDSDVGCLYCNELYSKSKHREQWIQCQLCRQWAHAECAGVSNKTKQFICEVCRD